MLHALPGGYNAGDMVFCYFPAYGANGESLTISGLAVTDIEVYKDGSTTQRASDNGYTLLDTDGIDFDGSTGLHGFKIDTSDNSDASFWADGSHYLIWVDAITINSQTVRFGFELRLGVLLRPTTAGRKLDVSSGGEAGIDWANIGSPTTTVGLGGTTVKTATDVETDTQDIQARLPAALVSGRMDSSVGAYQSGQAPLQPTVAGRTLDVNAGGEAGLDLDNTSGTLVGGTDITNLGTPQTGDSFARIGAAGAGLTDLGGMSTTMKGQVQQEVQDAIEVNHLDHLLAADYDPANKPGVATALLNELIGSDAGVSQFTANTLELGPAGGGGSANIVVQPYSHNAPQRVLGTQLTLFLGEFGFQFDTITAYDTQSPPVAINLTGMSLVLRIATQAGVELATPAVVVVSAAAGTWSFIVPAAITTALREEEQQLWWTLKDFVAGVRDETIGRGRIQVLRRDVTA